MRKKKIPHRIIHSRFLASDEVECSECGKRFRRKTKKCPGCGSMPEMDADGNIIYADRL